MLFDESLSVLIYDGESAQIAAEGYTFDDIF